MISFWNEKWNAFVYLPFDVLFCVSNFDSSFLFVNFFHFHFIHITIYIGDFEIVRTGDPLFVSLYGNEVIYYDGSYGDIVHLIFINEGGYYYTSSGTGIGVAVQAQYHIIDGTFLGTLPSSLSSIDWFIQSYTQTQPTLIH